MKLKVFCLKIIKRVPSSFLRVFFLKKMFGYKIGKNVKIGKVFINCKQVFVGNNVLIADMNNFSCGIINIGDNTKIHSGNSFLGKGKFIIGKDSRVINDHFFDLSNNIFIGDKTWIAGKNSQFWTHGSIETKLNKKDLSITIENNVYVSSSAKIAPGVKIASNNLVGIGSVVIGKFDESDTIILGNPAKVVKKNIDWRKNW
jgi:acetyltransferase-like isoleucine patch superfamily enzyme